MPQALPKIASKKESAATLVDGSNNQVAPAVSSIQQQKCVRFEPQDPANPYNWSKIKKIYILFTGILIVLNSTLGSSLPAGITPLFPATFSLSPTSPSLYLELTLPVTTYLIGYVVAPLLFGPLSETYGRRPVMLYTFLGYIMWTMACALSPNFTALIIFRLLAGICAAAPIVVTGGLYADIFGDPVSRGRAMAAFMASTGFGPTLVAPLISGYLAPISWKLPFWVALAIAGASLPPLLFMPETYGPILLVQKARALRKRLPVSEQPFIVAPLEANPLSVGAIITRVLTRPVRMFFTEQLVLFTCLYTALIYAIFYLFFEAYPIIFSTAIPAGYGLSWGPAALPFLPIGVGSVLSFPVFIAYDAFLRRAQAKGKAWSKRYEARRLPLCFIGGPLISVSIFWLSWTAQPSKGGSFASPWLPAMAGLPYGIGFVLIFMSLLNYLTDAYDIYAASALAAASCTRSLFGALLPLAAGKMYDTLGVQWAGSLLGFLSVLCLAVPFAFWVWGEKIREKSAFAGEVEGIKKRAREELEKEERNDRERAGTEKDLER